MVATSALDIFIDRFCGSLTPPPPIRIIRVFWSDTLSWGEASVMIMLYDTCFIFINTISLIDNNDTLSYGSVCLFINFLYNHNFLWLIKLRAASHPRLFPIFSSESMIWLILVSMWTTTNFVYNAICMVWVIVC